MGQKFGIIFFLDITGNQEEISNNAEYVNVMQPIILIVSLVIIEKI